MFTVLGVTVFIDLIVAVGIGMMMACLVFFKRQTDLQLSRINVIRDVDEEAILSAEEKELLRSTNGHLLLFHLGGPLSFGAAKEMVHMLSYQQNYRVLLLDLSDVPAIDYTVSRAIEDMIIDTTAQDRIVLVALPEGAVATMLSRERILENFPAESIHPNRVSALRHGAQLLSDQEL